MSSDSLVEIDVPDTWDRIPANEFVPLPLVIRRPADQTGPVTLAFVNHADAKRVTLNTDLFQRDVSLRPGESYALTLDVQFHSPGRVNLSEVYVEVKPAVGDSTLVRLPARDVQVVPSLTRQLDAKVERICTYDSSSKLEVSLQHVGETVWTDMEIGVGPAGRLRAGVACHRWPEFRRDQCKRFEIVVDGDTVELTLAGTADGERVTGRRSLLVPPADAGPVEHRPFTFLEPRALTTDRITIQLADGGPELQLRRGKIPVYGGGERYMVTIHPSEPHAKAVDLLGAPGQVEVEPMRSEGRAWFFLLTVVDNSWLTQTVRLYYDVEIPDRVLRGELFLMVQPSNVKLWTLAATAGAAITIKGFTALVPALVHPEHQRDDMISGLLELLEKRWTDWLQLLSIPVLRVGLGFVDRLLRPFREG
jgi:hypothetical protein